jgi:hypothetical protein
MSPGVSDDALAVREGGLNEAIERGECRNEEEVPNENGSA